MYTMDESSGDEENTDDGVAAFGQLSLDENREVDLLHTLCFFYEINRLHRSASMARFLGFTFLVFRNVPTTATKVNYFRCVQV